MSPLDTTQTRERQFTLLDPPLWRAIKDGDDEARRFFDEHYSRQRYADGRMPKLFVGPGFKLVLVTPCRNALFVWRKFRSDDGQQGINCAIFRTCTSVRQAACTGWTRRSRNANFRTLLQGQSGFRR